MSTSFTSARVRIFQKQDLMQKSKLEKHVAHQTDITN